MATFPLGVQGRRVLAAAILALVLVVVLWRHAAAGSPAPLSVAPAALPSHVAHVASARLLVVDVVGAVRRPGLVRLREGSRVADAIARAGGLERGAERTGVNFAAPVSDGQQVLVPAHGAAVAAAGAADGGSAPSAPVSLSSATAEQLDALPGVGPVTAQKIVAYRQQHGAFRSVDELDAISGIGTSRIADLRGLVVP
jgi:competence protein ComEA